jgi:uncharacterized protein (DUF2062 family)
LLSAEIRPLPSFPISMSRHDPHSVARHAQTRRLKKLLRFTPRRAMFHRYPFVGRFAAGARQRAYLWSFKPAHVRPAIYIGAILSMWPALGVQLVLALALSVILRANFMVTGALQFITNPITAAPVYYLTYRVGQFVMTYTGFATRKVTPTAPNPESVMIEISPIETLPAQFDWASGFGSTVIALFIGGTLCGIVLGVVLDLLYSAVFKLRHPVKRVRTPHAAHAAKVSAPDPESGKL